MGNESETTADKVQSLVDNLEDLANWSMTRGEQGSLVLQSALDEAKDNYNEIIKNAPASEN